MVEELAHLGVRYVIGYGSAGALDPSLALGQQVLAASAIGADGTSSAYNHSGIIEADPDLLQMTLRSAAGVGSSVTPVVAVTVDTFYRETKDLVAEWRGQGAQIVTFDASPLYAVAKACGIKTMWLSHVSDRLGGQWDDWFWDRDAATRVSERICAELCGQIIEESSKHGGLG
jgi:uridine phosphorylase